MVKYFYELVDDGTTNTKISKEARAQGSPKSGGPSADL